MDKHLLMSSSVRGTEICYLRKWSGYLGTRNRKLCLYCEWNCHWNVMSCCSRACFEKGEEQNHGDHFLGWEIWSLRISWLRSLVYGARPSAWRVKLYNHSSKWDLSSSVSTDVEFYCPFLSFFWLLYLIKQNFCSASRLLVSHLGWQELIPFLAVSNTSFHSTFGVSFFKHPRALSLEVPKALRRTPFTHKPTLLLIILLKLTTWMPTKSTSVTEHGLGAPTDDCQVGHCKYSTESPDDLGSRSSLALKETWSPMGADLGGC